MTFNLLTWISKTIISRLLTKNYLHTKFEESGTKRFRVISCTRHDSRTWPLTLTIDLLTWIWIGIISTHDPKIFYALKGCMHISHQQCVGCLSFQPYNVWIVKNSNKISTLTNLQNNTDVIKVRLQRQYTCKPCWSYVRAQVHTFIYRSLRYKFHGHLIPSHIQRVVAEWLWWWTCNLEALWCWWFESYHG